MVVVAIPTAIYLMFGSADDIRFLAGQTGREHSSRYTRLTAEGQYLDYWVGAQSLVSTADLCDLRRTIAGPVWIVVDSQRLDAIFAVGGNGQRDPGSTREVYCLIAGPFGDSLDIIVFRSIPQNDWSLEARRGCAAGGKSSPAP